jgi:hypothetical protein
VVSAHVSLSRRQRAQHLLLVLGLALAAAVAAAIFAEGRYARVLCDGYGRERQLTYVAFRYPPASPLSLLRAGDSSRCVFVDGSSVVSVDFRAVAPNPLTYWLVTLAMTVGATIPLFLVLFIVGLMQVYGALGITRRPGPADARDPSN